MKKQRSKISGYSPFESPPAHVFRYILWSVGALMIPHVLQHVYAGITCQAAVLSYIKILLFSVAFYFSKCLFYFVFL
jgi:hypothetical protein